MWEIIIMLMPSPLRPLWSKIFGGRLILSCFSSGRFSGRTSSAAGRRANRRARKSSRWRCLTLASLLRPCNNRYRLSGPRFRDGMPFWCFLFPTRPGSIPVRLLSANRMTGPRAWTFDYGHYLVLPAFAYYVAYKCAACGRECGQDHPEQA